MLLIFGSGRQEKEPERKRKKILQKRVDKLERVC